MKLRMLIEELNLFQRERIPTEVRILGIATYIQTSSIRRTAKTLLEIHPVSHTAIWKWIKKFEQKLPITEKKKRNLIAIDETVVKANKKRYFVFSAVDVDRNKLITTRNYLTAKSFIKEVLNCCENKPKFVVGKAPWLKRALESLGLDFEHETFRKA